MPATAHGEEIFLKIQLRLIVCLWQNSSICWALYQKIRKEDLPKKVENKLRIGGRQNLFSDAMLFLS